MAIEQIPLRFAEHAVDAQTHVNLSAIRPDGTCLWIAGDETATVERLTADGTGYGKHTTFRLAMSSPCLAAREDEVDVEGLARHGPYLWAVGSHSSRRKRIKAKHEGEQAVRRLAQVTDEPSRRVVAYGGNPNAQDYVPAGMFRKGDGNVQHIMASTAHFGFTSTRVMKLGWTDHPGLQVYLTR